MKILINQPALASGLSFVSRSIPSKPYLPILSNVLLTTEDGQVRLSTTDLRISTSCLIGAKIIEEGAVTIPAQHLIDFVSRLPAQPIEIDLTESSQTVNLSCVRTKVHIKGVPPTDFPDIPDFPLTDVPSLDLGMFIASIRCVAFAAADIEKHPMLSSVYITPEDDTSVMVATDSYRLSAQKLDARISDSSVLVPAASLTSFMAIARGLDAHLSVWVNTQLTQIMFRLTPTDANQTWRKIIFTSQLVDGTFPDYHAIMPRVKKLSAEFSRKECQGILSQATVFADSALRNVILEIKPNINNPICGTLTLTAANATLGDHWAQMDAQVIGEEVQMALNADYFNDVLKALDVDTIKMELTSHSLPALVTIPGYENFKHILMPLHVAE